MRTIYRGDALYQSLTSLHKSIPEIMMSVVVNNTDGLVIATYASPLSTINEPDAIAAASAILLDMAANSLTRLEKEGLLRRIIMQWNGGTLVVYRCTYETSLATFINKEAKLGIALVATEQTAHSVSEIMA